MCSGIHHTPNRELEGTLLKDFEGKIYHVGEIKKFVPEEERRRIMVLGGGESASDIVEEWARSCGVDHLEHPARPTFLPQVCQAFASSRTTGSRQGVLKSFEVYYSIREGKTRLAAFILFYTQFHFYVKYDKGEITFGVKVYFCANASSTPRRQRREPRAFEA